MKQDGEFEAFAIPNLARTDSYGKHFNTGGTGGTEETRAGTASARKERHLNQVFGFARAEDFVGCPRDPRDPRGEMFCESCLDSAPAMSSRHVSQRALRSKPLTNSIPEDRLLQADLLSRGDAA